MFYKASILGLAAAAALAAFAAQAGAATLVGQ